jgi:hypothetical protein
LGCLRTFIAAQLQQLCRAAGIDIKPEIFEKVLELIRMDVSPVAIAQVNMYFVFLDPPTFPNVSAAPQSLELACAQQAHAEPVA